MPRRSFFSSSADDVEPVALHPVSFLLSHVKLLCPTGLWGKQKFLVSWSTLWNTCLVLWLHAFQFCLRECHAHCHLTLVVGWMLSKIVSTMVENNALHSSLKKTDQGSIMKSSSSIPTSATRSRTHLHFSLWISPFIRYYTLMLVLYIKWFQISLLEIGLVMFLWHS